MNLPTRNLLGEIDGIFVHVTDVTDMVLARRTIEDSASQLQRLNRDLEEFSYVASHDLQEPLRMVKIYTQLVLRNQNATRETLDEYSRFIEQGVARMQSLVQDLPAFLKSVHTNELVTGAADLAEALIETMDVLRSRIEDEKATITVCALPQTRGDTSKISHVFQNLLSNALKYRKPNVAPEIRSPARRAGDMSIISVAITALDSTPGYADAFLACSNAFTKANIPAPALA